MCIRVGNTKLWSFREVVVTLGCKVQERFFNFAGDAKERYKNTMQAAFADLATLAMRGEEDRMLLRLQVTWST